MHRMLENNCHKHSQISELYLRSTKEIQQPANFMYQNLMPSEAHH